MADEVAKVVIEVEFKGNASDAEASANSLEGAVDKVKKKASETNTEFGLSDTKIGRMFNTFKDGAQKGVAAMSTLKGAIAATGIGLLLIAVAGIVNWFKKTEEGAEKLEQVMAALGNIIRTGPLVVFNALKVAVTAIAGVFTGDFSKAKDAVNDLKESTKQLTKGTLEAYELKKKEQDLEDRTIENSTKSKKLMAEIADLREQASDEQTKLSEKTGIYNQILEKQNEYYENNKKLAEESVQLLKDKSEQEKRSGGLSEETKNALIAAEGRLWDVEREHDSALRLINRQKRSVNSQLISDAKERAKAETEASEEIRKAREKELSDVNDIAARIAISRAEGREKDILELGAWYQKEREAHINNKTYLELLNVEYKEKEAAINKEYRDKEKEEEAAALAEVDELIAYYDERDLERKKQKAEEEKQLRELAMDSTVQIVNAAASAVGAIWDSQMKEELKNENLTQKQKDAIQRKYFEKQKKLAMTMLIINTGVAIMNAWREGSWIENLIETIAISALAVAQGAEIMSQKYALGGKITGPSHTNGGVPIVAEGGEFVVNARTMSNPELASTVIAANAAGNGQSSSAIGLTKEELTSAIINGIVAIPIYIDEEGSFKTYKLGKKVETRESKYIK